MWASQGVAFCEGVLAVVDHGQSGHYHIDGFTIPALISSSTTDNYATSAWASNPTVPTGNEFLELHIDSNDGVLFMSFSMEPNVTTDYFLMAVDITTGQTVLNNDSGDSYVKIEPATGDVDATNMSKFMCVGDGVCYLVVQQTLLSTTSNTALGAFPRQPV